jgi:hypothetical protein
MLPVYVDLGSQTRGDTWEGLEIGPVVDQDSNPMEYPCVSCRIDFRHKVSGTLGLRLTSISTQTIPSSITIINGTTWEFSVPERILLLDVGSWEWDFETTDSQGVVRTLYYGDLVIVKDITRT